MTEAGINDLFASTPVEGSGRAAAPPPTQPRRNQSRVDGTPPRLRYWGAR